MNSLSDIEQSVSQLLKMNLQNSGCGFGNLKIKNGMHGS